MTTNFYIMSDDMALGFFDADGGILLNAELKTNMSGNSIIYAVQYSLGQSLSKEDAVTKFAEKFGGNTRADASDVEFRHNQSSEVGNRVREFLTLNKPKHPYRLRDFYISEQVIGLLNKDAKSSVDHVTLARLVSNKHVLKAANSSEATFEKYCTHIGASAQAIKQGSKIADDMLLDIEAKLEANNRDLLTAKLSNDYVLGSHFGDGSLYFGLSWQPTANDHRLRCEPEWAISGDDDVYCRAFANTFNGITKSVDRKGQRKFALSSLTKCSGIVSLFEGAAWFPSYKKKQFDRWRESLRLIEAQEHFSESGIRKLLDLTYGLAEKGKRKYTKDQYLAWGLEWLNKPERQKRKPKGEKP